MKNKDINKKKDTSSKKDVSKVRDIIIDIAGDTPNDRERADKILDLAYYINEHIDNKFKKEFPDKYEQWSGNHCLQTSIMTCGILESIEDLKPEVVYCIMTDIYKGKNVCYNHAYVAVTDSYNNSRYVIDMARNDRDKLFISKPKDKLDIYVESRCGYRGYGNIFIVGHQHVDYKKALLFDIEYFTGEPSFYLFNEIREKFKNEIKELQNWGVN